VITPGERSWVIRIQRRRRGVWFTLTRTYTVRPGAVGRTINLPRGTYRATLGAQGGFAEAVSSTVTLRQ
jgi:hypothetical protein